MTQVWGVYGCSWGYMVIYDGWIKVYSIWWVYEVYDGYMEADRGIWWYMMGISLSGYMTYVWWVYGTFSGYMFIYDQCRGNIGSYIRVYVVMWWYMMYVWGLWEVYGSSWGNIMIYDGYMVW